MASARLTDGLLNAALVVGGLLVAALLYGFVSRAISTGPGIERPAADHARIQIEVRNAAGVDGLAARTTEFLRGRGFDVVDLGNAAARDTSTVLVRSGTALDARTVAEALGLSADRVVTGGPLTDYALDVTVYLGADYAQLSPFAEE